MTYRQTVRFSCLLMAMICAATPGDGQASTIVSTTFAVTATVSSVCVISAVALPFGTYSSVVLNGTTTVTPTCTSGTTYNIGLDVGQGSGATVAVRKMTLSAGNTLNYSLYSDTNHSVVWGPTIGTNTVTGTGNGAAQPLTVYGQIPASQYPIVGSYTDTVTATVTY